MNNQLAVIQDMTLADTMQLGKVLADSGFFQDSKGAAQAIVKILAGRELGFGPVASMTGINVIKGKVSLSANLIAAAIKRSGKYNYKVVQLEDDGCTIEFYEGNQPVGQSTFTMEDAKRAGLGGDNWRKYPKNMCFARAISNGAKWYCPDLSGGPMYTPDELGAAVDGETGEVITIVDDGRHPHQSPAVVDHQPVRPFSPEACREYIRSMVDRKQNAMNGTANEPASDKARGLFVGKLNEAFAGDDADKKRRSVVKYLFALDSTKQMTKAQVSAGIEWLIERKDEDSGDYILDKNSIKEAIAIERQVLIDAGQQEIVF